MNSLRPLAGSSVEAVLRLPGPSPASGRKEIEVACDDVMQVGECPLWHPQEAALYWVDIEACAVHRLHPASGEHRQWQMAAQPSALALSAGADGGLIVALRSGIIHLNTQDGSVREIAPRPTTPASPASTMVVPMRRAASGSAPFTSRATGRRRKCFAWNGASCGWSGRAE